MHAFIAIYIYIYINIDTVNIAQTQDFRSIFSQQPETSVLNLNQSDFLMNKIIPILFIKPKLSSSSSSSSSLSSSNSSYRAFNIS